MKRCFDKLLRNSLRLYTSLSLAQKNSLNLMAEPLRGYLAVVGLRWKGFLLCSLRFCSDSSRLLLISFADLIHFLKLEILTWLDLPKDSLIHLIQKEFDRIGYMMADPTEKLVVSLSIGFCSLRSLNLE